MLSVRGVKVKQLGETEEAGPVQAQALTSTKAAWHMGYVCVCVFTVGLQPRVCASPALSLASGNLDPTKLVWSRIVCTASLYTQWKTPQTQKHTSSEQQGGASRMLAIPYPTCNFAARPHLEADLLLLEEQVLVGLLGK